MSTVEKSKRDDWGKYTALAVATAALGGLVGWLTGASGVHPDVVSALVPVVIAASGATAFYAAQRNIISLSTTATACGIVLFCMTIFGGIGAAIGARDADANPFSAIQVQLLVNERRLEMCSMQEYRVNRARAALELVPLPIEYFCK